jgi:hypothetical protein
MQTGWHKVKNGNKIELMFFNQDYCKWYSATGDEYPESRFQSIEFVGKNVNVIVKK